MSKGFKAYYIVIILALVYILKNIKDILKGSSEEDLSGSDLLSEVGSTLTNIEAESMADSIYVATALHNASFGGTDETLIYEQFDKMKNQADFNKVYNAFGKRQYSTFWGNQGDPLSSEKFDMLFILNNELNESEKYYVKTNFTYLNIFG